MNSARVAAYACAACCLASAAHADPSAPDRLIEIHVDGSALALSKTRESAQDLLSRLELAQVTLAEGEAAPPRPATEVFARAYIDLRTAAPRIVIVDGRTQRELARRTLPPSDSLETEVEAVTHVLYMVVDALLEAEVAPPPAPAAEAPPAPIAPPSAPPERAAPAVTPPTHYTTTDEDSAPPTQLAVDASVLFRTLYLGADALAPGGGLALDLRTLSAEPHWCVSLLGAVHAPVRRTADDVGVELQPVSLRVAPAVESALARNLRLATGISAGLDWFSVEAVRIPDGATRRARQQLFDFTLGAQLALRLRPPGRWALSIGGGVDLDLTPKTFFAQTDDKSLKLFDLPQFRPWLMLSGTYSLSDASAARSEI